jgi:hypothetical protein
MRIPGSAQRVALDHPDQAWPAASSADSNRPPSSTALFFRKVYYLASVRLLDLCDRLRIDERGKQRVWTLFEHVLRTETSLMTGRHLDQNLMCCIYVVAKVDRLFLLSHLQYFFQITKQDVPFHDIMYHYRHQPQATSRVYRRVLMDPATSPATIDDGASRDSLPASGGGGKLRSGSTLPVPGMSSAPPTPEPKEHDYADLIRYYNRVFVSRVEEFVKKLQPVSGDAKEVRVFEKIDLFLFRTRQFHYRQYQMYARIHYRRVVQLPIMCMYCRCQCYRCHRRVHFVTVSIGHHRRYPDSFIS